MKSSIHKHYVRKIKKEKKRFLVEWCPSGFDEAGRTQRCKLNKGKKEKKDKKRIFWDQRFQSHDFSSSLVQAEREREMKDV